MALMSSASSKSVSNLSLFTVDAFSKKPFKGNGAAVCLVPYDQTVAADVKQKIAAEMNLSETAFISILEPKDTFQSGHRFKLQWFTPTCEVSLCGHATLASAAVLFEVYGNKSEALEFETVSGVLKASKSANKQIEIDLPAYTSKPVDDKYNDLVKAVVGSLSVKNVVLSESKKLLIQLSDDISREQLELFNPHDAELLSCTSDLKGVIVTLKASSVGEVIDGENFSFDFISRYFAPWLGVSEDPVTGSAHSVLGPYWSEVLGKKSLFARQCSPRGGNLHVRVHENRVHILGDAVVVVKGNISF